MSEEARLIVEWRDIEEAPRDGTAILAYTPNRPGYVSRQDIHVIHWSEWGSGVWETVSGGKPTDTFTHFMPLPDPPPPAKGSIKASEWRDKPSAR